jgi:DNA-directed RNA polymerase specialized sigma24 family protein
MATQDDFHDLIRRVRLGDEDAARTLVSQFEPFMLRVVRFRLRHRADYDRLRHDFGSVDVCQSVFKSLFERLKDGRFDLNEPQDMEKLLAAMIRFKIANKARRLSTVWREIVSHEPSGYLVDPGPSAEKLTEDKDLSETIFRLFSTDELEILNRRLDHQSWPEIAIALGAGAEALRKRLERAFERVREDPGMRSVFAS